MICSLHLCPHYSHLLSILFFLVTLDSRQLPARWEIKYEEYSISQSIRTQHANKTMFCCWQISSALFKRTAVRVKANKKKQSSPLCKLEVTQPEDGCFQMTRKWKEESLTLSKKPKMILAEAERWGLFALWAVVRRSLLLGEWGHSSPPHWVLFSSRRSRKVTLRTVRTAPARPHPLPLPPLLLSSKETFN